MIHPFVLLDWLGDVHPDSGDGSSLSSKADAMTQGAAVSSPPKKWHWHPANEFTDHRLDDATRKTAAP
ncbi:MAG TPA: hypothetical protein VGM62_12285 [Chthoniobacterales bacterium]